MTIYRRPRDYPDAEYVVRQFHVLRPGAEVVPIDVLGTAATLVDARALVPEGLLLIPRSPEDDPVIVESWI